MSVQTVISERMLLNITDAWNSTLHIICNSSKSAEQEACRGPDGQTDGRTDGQIVEYTTPGRKPNAAIRNLTGSHSNTGELMQSLAAEVGDVYSKTAFRDASITKKTVGLYSFMMKA